jgi:segregation and condensation protein B
MNLKAQVEALLHITPRPLAIKKIAGLLEVEVEKIEEVVNNLTAEYKTREGGLLIMRHGEEAQIITNPETSNVVSKFLKEETTGELTKPSLETLSVIAYRGPITKSDLEKIRGVNCTMILRNLMMRGLVVAEDNKRKLVTYYTISADLLKHLGLSHVSELPDYDKLHNPEVVTRLLQEDVQA